MKDDISSNPVLDKILLVEFELFYGFEKLDCMKNIKNTYRF